MVIYIDKTIDQELSGREITQDENNLFLELAIACRQGVCYLCGDRGSLLHLSEIEELPLRGIYQEVDGHYAEHGAVLSAVDPIFVLTFLETAEAEALPMLLRKKTCRSLPIPLCIGEKWKLFRECCLLGENLDDTGLYQLIGQNYYIQKGFHGIELKFHHVAGGGDTTKDSLWNLVDQEKWPTLCLADSDQKYPSDVDVSAPIGSTLKHLIGMKECLEESNVLPFQLFPLHVHEVENLLPLSVLREVADKELLQMNPGLDLLERLKTVQDGVPLLYYDFKNGFSRINDERQRSYWEKVKAELSAKDGDASTHSFLGLGKQSPLRRACSIIERILSEDKSVLELDEYLKPQWEQIGATVFSWGCANQPLRS